MKRTAIVLSARKFTSKAGKELLALTTTTEPVIVNAKFAEANGIDSSFGGILMIQEEACKAGETWINEETGESGEYTKDFNKVVSIMPLNGPIFQKKYEEAVEAFLAK